MFEFLGKILVVFKLRVSVFRLWRQICFLYILFGLCRINQLKNDLEWQVDTLANGVRQQAALLSNQIQIHSLAK